MFVARHSTLLPARSLRALAALALCAGALTLTPSHAHAGGVEYLTNQSADYIRTFSRNAAIDGVDAVTYNPSGVPFLGKGIHLGVNNQTIFGEYSATFRGTKYPADVLVPALPSLFAAYNMDSLSLFVGVSVPSGGGSLEYGNGIPYLIPLVVYADGATDTNPTNGKFSGSSINYGVNIGAAYKILDMLSVSIGARVNLHNKAFDGEVTYGSAVAELHTEKKATGFTPIAGLTLRPGFGLTVSLRYEMETAMEFESTSTTKNLLDQAKWGGTPLESFATGAKEQRNMPAVLGGGISWSGPMGLTLSTSFHYYFTKNADKDTDNPATIQETGLGSYVKGWDDDYDNGWDLAVSAEYTVLSTLTVSAGYIRTVTGGNEKTYSDFEYALDSHSVGAGVRVRITKLIGATLGVSRTFFTTGKGKLADPIQFNADTETFNKKAYDVALGLQVSL